MDNRHRLTLELSKELAAALTILVADEALILTRQDTFPTGQRRMGKACDSESNWDRNRRRRSRTQTLRLDGGIQPIPHVIGQLYQ